MSEVSSVTFSVITSRVCVALPFFIVLRKYLFMFKNQVFHGALALTSFSMNIAPFAVASLSVSVSFSTRSLLAVNHTEQPYECLLDPCRHSLEE